MGICLGGALLLISVAAVSCFCYRGRQIRNHKLRPPVGGYRARIETKPLPFRKPTAVKSPNSVAGVPAHYLKKSPSPTGVKSPPGSCHASKTLSSPLCGIQLECVINTFSFIFLNSSKAWVSLAFYFQFKLSPFYTWPVLLNDIIKIVR